MSIITGGYLKGRKLRAPRGGRTRPTSSFVREALFSMLSPWLSGARVLDLFAGTGALGLEALSRGAEHAVFVDAFSCKILKANVSMVGTDSTEVLCMDVLKALKSLSENHVRFDIVLLDPPYDARGLQAEALEFLYASGMVSPDGLVVLERRRDGEVPATSWGSPFRQRRWGDTEVLIWKT